MDKEGAYTDELIKDINQLLKHLNIPLVLLTPYDMTPSFLLILLESILQDRLPIPPETRNSTQERSKVEMMKILLGVLEDDILQKDIGLSEVDPKRLAAGELDELVLVGQVLCQLGYDKLMLPKPLHGKRNFHDEEEENEKKDARIAVRPSSRITGNTNSSTIYSSYEDSETAPTSVFDDPTTPTRKPSPKCIHQLEFPEFAFHEITTEDDESLEGITQSLCDCSIVSHGILDLDAPGPNQSTPGNSTGTSIRHEGLLRRVSEEEEIREFESRRNCVSHPLPLRDTPKLLNPNKYVYSTQYTLALLRERAELLEELARLKLLKASGSIHP